MNPIPIKFQSLFHYKERWQVLICIHCGYDVSSKSLIKYDPSNEKRNTRHSLKRYLHCPPLTRLTIFHVPEHSSPIDGIRTQQGYKCNHCNDMLTVNKTYMGTYISNKHPDVRTSSKPGVPIDRLLFRREYIKENIGPLSIPISSFQSSTPSDLANLDSSNGSTAPSIL